MLARMRAVRLGGMGDLARGLEAGLTVVCFCFILVSMQHVKGGRMGIGEHGWDRVQEMRGADDGW
jgi:hypothetical protein